MYIDPNAGGILFQCLACLFSIAILAVIVGAVVFFAKKGTNKPEERKMNQAPIKQAPIQHDPIELDREDCVKIIDILEKHGKNKGANWEAWASQINQIIQSSLDKLPDEPKVVVSLEKANWKAVQDIIQKACEELGGEWLEWSQKISQTIDTLYPKIETPPPPRVMPPASVNPTNAKPGCPNCRSFNTVRHKTYLIGWGWGKIVIGLFLAEIFIGVIPFYWGVIDLIRAKKIPSKNEWLCKNCKYTWVQE